MTRITSRYLPRARALLEAFRSAGAVAPGMPRAEAMRAERERQQCPAGWPVPRERLAAQLKERLDGESLPQQSGTSYCGCAAFLYCLLQDRPDWYVAYATALWRGTPFAFAAANTHIDIAVADGTRRSLMQIQRGKPRGGSISDLDWMTMASLNGATRPRLGDAPGASGPGDKPSAVTWPWMVRRWFASVAAPARIDSVGWGLYQRGVPDLLDLLERWNGHWLVLEIDASLLEGGSTSIGKRHWVVVDPETLPLFQPAGQKGGMDARSFRALRQRRMTETVSRQTDAYGGAAAVGNEEAFERQALARLRVVSWGNEHYPVRNPTVGNIVDRFYGGYAFPRFGR